MNPPLTNTRSDTYCSRQTINSLYLEWGQINILQMLFGSFCHFAHITSTNNNVNTITNTNIETNTSTKPRTNINTNTNIEKNTSTKPNTNINTNTKTNIEKTQAQKLTQQIMIQLCLYCFLEASKLFLRHLFASTFVSRTVSSTLRHLWPFGWITTAVFRENINLSKTEFEEKNHLKKVPDHQVQFLNGLAFFHTSQGTQEVWENAKPFKNCTWCSGTFFI